MAQPQSYRDEVLPPDVWRRVSLEAGATFGWSALVGERGTALGLDRYGASAPAPEHRARARHHARGRRRGRRARSLPAVSEGRDLTSWGVRGVVLRSVPAGSGEYSGERGGSPPPHQTEERDAENQLLAIAVIAAIVAVPSAQAHKGDGNGWKVVASGLDNPRGIDVAKNGDIWIAEAGKGGAGPCVASPRIPIRRPSCFGLTRCVHASSTRAGRSASSPACRRSATQGTGDDAEGAADIVVERQEASPASSAAAAHAGCSARRSAAAGALFGWVVKIDPWKGSVWPFADIVAVRGRQQPGRRRDRLRTPTASPCVTAATSSPTPAATSVLGVTHKKVISTLAVFPDTLVDAPPFLGLPAGHEDPDAGRPDDRRRAAEGSERLRRPADGLPVPARRGERVGASQPDGTTTVYASGFTNIVDIAWGPKGSLYVLEISANGLLSGDPTGALIRVWPNGKQDRRRQRGPRHARPASRSARTARCTCPTTARAPARAPSSTSARCSRARAGLERLACAL